MNIQIIIIFFLVLLFFIDYYHKQYRIKYSKKNLQYRNSHSFYDDTDYARYKHYREIYTYKIAAIILIAALILDTLLNKNYFAINYIMNFLIKSYLFESWKDALRFFIIFISIYFIFKYKYKKKNIHIKLNLEFILKSLILFVSLLFISSIVYH